MFREKKQSRSGALKVLSYATAIPDGGPNCDKFVEIYGRDLLLLDMVADSFRSTDAVSYVNANTCAD